MELATLSGGAVDTTDENQFLHRNFNAADPTLNQLNTALGMSGNDITGVGNLGAATVAATGAITGDSLAVTNAITGTSATTTGNINAGGSLSAGTTLSVSGVATFLDDVNATGEVTADYVEGRYFRDSANSTYILNPDSTSTLRTVNATGAVTADYVEGRYFRDSANSTYILNPDGGSTINRLSVRGTARFYDAVTMDDDLTIPRLFYTSDEALKTDISDVSGLELISQLKPKSYTWKDTGEKAMGFIAQDVEEILPHLVTENPKTGMKAVNYLDLIAPLVKSVQELQAEVQALKSQ
jgi:hypothetical protein